MEKITRLLNCVIRDEERIYIVYLTTIPNKSYIGKWLLSEETELAPEIYFDMIQFKNFISIYTYYTKFTISGPGPEPYHLIVKRFNCDSWLAFSNVDVGDRSQVSSEEMKIFRALNKDFE